MSNEGVLCLSLKDEAGRPIAEPVDIELRHERVTDRRVLKEADASTTIRIENLRPDPDGLYQISIASPSFRPVRQVVKIRSDRETELEIILQRARTEERTIDTDPLFRKAAADPETSRRLREAPDIMTFIQELRAFAERSGFELTEDQARTVVLETFTQASRLARPGDLGLEAALAIRAGSIFEATNVNQLQDRDLELVVRFSPVQLINTFVLGETPSSWCMTGMKKTTKVCA